MGRSSASAIKIMPKPTRVEAVTDSGVPLDCRVAPVRHQHGRNVA
jgi:hypothetical protein